MAVGEVTAKAELYWRSAGGGGNDGSSTRSRGYSKRIRESWQRERVPKASEGRASNFVLRLQAGRGTAETRQWHFREVAVRLFLLSVSGVTVRGGRRRTRRENGGGGGEARRTGLTTFSGLGTGLVACRGATHGAYRRGALKVVAGNSGIY